MNPANCVYRNFHRAAHLMQKSSPLGASPFYNQSQTHALLSDRLPRIVLPGAHPPPNVRRHRAPEILLLFFRHLCKPMQWHMNGRTPQMHCSIRETVQNQPGVRVFTQFFTFPASSSYPSSVRSFSRRIIAYGFVASTHANCSKKGRSASARLVTQIFYT